MEDIFDIKGRVVLVTGAAKGIGRHLAIAMAGRGAVVYAVNRSASDGADHGVVEKLCDVTDTVGFARLCSEVFEEHGSIDVLVNNAGVTFTGAGGEPYPRKQWDETIEINLTAAFNCTQTVCEYMAKKGKGSVINVTSLNALLAFPNNPAYVASKGGLMMLGKALARDWGRRGIRVNNLAPGYIKTRMTAGSYSDEVSRAQRESNTMLGRWGEASDLVGACVFLASDASAYITGQDIYVDGGWSANGLQSLE